MQNVAQSEGTDLRVLFLLCTFCFHIRNSQHHTYLNALAKHFSLQISKRGNSFHQQFAKQSLQAAVTSDLFVV